MDRVTLDALIGLIEYKDASTAAHTWRVVLYSLAVSDRLRVPDEIKARVALAAALHDVGKIDVPSAVLRKPGPLTDAEFAQIRRHPVDGYRRLRSLGESDPLVLDLVRYHHERWDGGGYPDGLAGREIPRPARLFAVIDTFDALTSLRPYRREAGPGAAPRAIEIIHEGVGTQYDPRAVEIFSDLHESGELEWILNYYNTPGEMSELGGRTEAVDDGLRGDAASLGRADERTPDRSSLRRDGLDDRR
ncbi:MAG: HD-GYP domain-containing protein [Planctomycetota bacterium]